MTAGGGTWLDEGLYWRGPEPPKGDDLVDGELVLEPPCRYCAFQMMCNGAPH